MFMVYSPEGQSFIGAAQNLPVLKVDPAKRINRVEDTELSGVKVDVKDSNSSQKKEALNAYKKNQQNSGERRVIVSVAEIMSTPVISVQSNASLENAWALMQKHNIKHLPVMDVDSLVGICSQTDLLARMLVGRDGQIEGVKRETVAQVMHPQVITTTAETEIRHVAQVLTEFDVDSLVILNDYQKLLGIVTEKDLITRLAQEPPIEIYT